MWLLQTIFIGNTCIADKNSHICAKPICDHIMGKSSLTGKITWEPNLTPSLAVTRKPVSGSQALQKQKKTILQAETCSCHGLSCTLNSSHNSKHLHLYIQ